MSRPCVFLFTAAFVTTALAQAPPDPDLMEWRTKVTTAKAMDNGPENVHALLTLVREALETREVQASGGAHPDAVHPADNRPVPVINFDKRLNQKRSATQRDGTARSLEGNFGYYFSMGGKGYVVLGPAALDPRSPAFTRLAAEHELFHAEHHVGDPRALADRELETWSHMFVRFFREVHAFKKRWAPLYTYYADATAAERTRAIERLAAYYHSPGAPDDEAAVEATRTAFRAWMDDASTNANARNFVAHLRQAVAGRSTKATWTERVMIAAAIEDPSRRADALLALAEEALAPLEVRWSGTAHPDAVHHEDNAPAPIVNFDPRMNEKHAYRASRTLETTPAYYFSAGGLGYVMIGPRSVDPRSPVFTQMFVEHELFHAKRHIGDPRPIGDRELETWTHVFVTYFHEVHPFKQRWAPLVSFYEDADPGEQKASLNALVGYYGSAEPGVRMAFDEWLGRRRKDAATKDSKMVADLDRALSASKGLKLSGRF